MKPGPDPGPEPRCCIYCGSAENLTADHIPPKCLFPSPRPSSLITVPACRSCNKSYERDDEWFRVFALAQATLDPTWQRLWDQKVVGSSLRRSPRLRSVLARLIVKAEVVTPAGLHLGEVEVLTFPKDRIRRVVERIARGLLWRHHRVQPGPEVEFMIWTGNEPGVRTVRDLVSLVGPQTRVRSIGGSVFRYRGGAAVEDPEQSIWLLGFYDKLLLLVLTSREDRGS